MGNLSQNENILLIRLKSIGDVLFTLPAVHRVRENFPGAKITFLTSRENAPLLEGFREVDGVITLDRARFQSGNPMAILSEAFSLFRRLRAGKVFTRRGFSRIRRDGLAGVVEWRAATLGQRVWSGTALGLHARRDAQRPHSSR